MIITGTLRDMLAAVESAESLAVRGLRDGTIETEPTLTDRFLGALEQAITSEGLPMRGYRLSIRTLRDRGPGAPERQFGADLVAVFELDTPECRLSKGFLAQAKLADKSDVTIDEAREFPVVSVRRPQRREERPSDLVPQCDRMLHVSPDSFVFVYSERSISVVSANTVAHLAPDGGSHPVYSMTLRRFFRSFFQSFVGDYRLSAFDDQTLQRLRNLTLATSAALLTLRGE
jgi:hypothetical protein